MIDVEHDVDGDVPVFWLEQEESRVRGGLLFRVGVADETFTTRGITAMVLDLAVDAAGYHDVVEPAVELSVCRLDTEGTMEEVVERLQTLSAYLAALPVRRFEQVRSLRFTRLVQPAPDHERPSLGPPLADRCGAQTYGLGEHDELALCRVDAGEVLAWCRRFFTAGNAAAWFVGATPPEFELALDPGWRESCPPLSDTGVPLPAHMVASPHGFVWFTSVAEASIASTAGVLIARDRAFAGLRGGFRTVCDVRQLDSWHHAVALGAGSPEVGDADVLAFWANLCDDLRDEGPTPRELRGLVRSVESAARDDDWLRDRPLDLARAHLLGAPVRTIEELVDAYDAVTPAAASRAWRELLGRAIWRVPEVEEGGERGGGGPADIARLDVAMPGIDLSTWSAGVPDGRVFRPVAPDPDEPGHLLALSSTSVSEVFDDAVHVTVPFDACAGYVVWTEGCRTVVGLDGGEILLDPARWRDGDTLVARLDAAVPEAVRLDALVTPPFVAD